MALSSEELIQRLRYPPQELDPTIPMFEAAEMIERLTGQLEQATAAMENEAIVTRDLRNQLVCVQSALRDYDQDK